jgi:hypothetical protein
MARSPKINKSHVKEAARYIDLKLLFPKSTVNTRSNPTPYQARKIKAAMNKIIHIAGGYDKLQREFVPVKHAKDYNKKSGLPIYTRGLFLKGGERDNTGAVYDKKKGNLEFKRGGSPRILRPLNNWSERTLRQDIEKALEELPKKGGDKRLTANGRIIRNTQSNDDKFLKDRAVELYNKYKGMAQRGEKREIAPGRFVQAAHPKEWGLGIQWEKTLTMNQEAGAAWLRLSPEDKAGWKEGAKFLNTTPRRAFMTVYKDTH